MEIWVYFAHELRVKLRIFVVVFVSLSLLKWYLIYRKIARIEQRISIYPSARAPVLVLSTCVLLLSLPISVSVFLRLFFCLSISLSFYVCLISVSSSIYPQAHVHHGKQLAFLRLFAEWGRWAGGHWREGWWKLGEAWMSLEPTALPHYLQVCVPTEAVPWLAACQGLDFSVGACLFSLGWKPW